MYNDYKKNHNFDSFPRDTSYKPDNFMEESNSEIKDRMGSIENDTNYRSYGQGFYNSVKNDEFTSTNTDNRYKTANHWTEKKMDFGGGSRRKRTSINPNNGHENPFNNNENNNNNLVKRNVSYSTSKLNNIDNSSRGLDVYFFIYNFIQKIIYFSFYCFLII
jgi:hypothetical protein